VWFFVWFIECQEDILKVASEGETIEQNLQFWLIQDRQILLSEDMSTLLLLVDSPQAKLKLLKLHCFTFFGRDDKRLRDFIEAGRALLSIYSLLRLEGGSPFRACSPLIRFTPIFTSVPTALLSIK
jgi:hypothetical protein